MEFKKFLQKDFQGNPFEMLDKEWMLVTAGALGEYNTMTASWGGFGVIWDKPVAMVVVRLSRFTLEFMEKYDYFTCSFYPEEYREALNICGTKSGRDIDKAKETGLTPVSVPGIAAVTFGEARLTLVMRKLLHQDLSEQAFTDKKVYAANYPDGDIHRLFVGAIEQYGE
ncbi:MAG: flavin reductase [Clostridiales bacterium]|nr:flavin reductase [Clostridiales bacterium]